MIKLENYTKEQIKRHENEHVDMHGALEEIVNICEDTPEGSKKQILDKALNEIMGIAKQYVRPHDKRE